MRSRRMLCAMGSASRIALGTALAVACVALLGGGALALASTVFTRTDHHSRVIRGDVSRVVVETRTGDVTLRPGDAGRVTVAETRRFWLRKPRLDVALRDGVLAIKVDCGSFGPACSDDLDVIVPAGVGRTRVSADSGDVDVTGMRGTIDLSADSGDIDADAITGDITMRAGSGDVTAGAVRADTVSASADSGDAPSRFSRRPASCRRAPTRAT
jgi:Toastrack DUF4097